MKINEECQFELVENHVSSSLSRTMSVRACREPVEKCTFHYNVCMRDYWVYILHCSDGTYYTGITNDLQRRLEEHGSGQDSTSYTASRKPIKLVYSHSFDDVLQAIAWEKRVKDWNRKKKEALIRGDFDALPELSKSKTAKI